MKADISTIDPKQNIIIKGAKLHNLKKIDVWGDGEQTRSFMYIDDCIIGTKKLFLSDSSDVYNIGSEEQVSINQMISIIEEIAGYKVVRNYQLDKPKGVRGRSSNNDLVRGKLGWNFEVSLKSSSYCSNGRSPKRCFCQTS